MPRAYLQITPELLTEICKGVTEGESPRYFGVLEGLPKDVRCYGACSVRNNVVTILIESDQLEEAKQYTPLLRTIELDTDQED